MKIMLFSSLVLCVILITNIYPIKTAGQDPETQEETMKNPTCSTSTEKDDIENCEIRKSIKQPFCEAKERNGEIYCENPEDYPLEKINDLLSTINIDQRNGVPVIQNRMYDSVCPSYKRTVRPLIGQTEEGRWFPILNIQFTNISQEVEVFECSLDNCSTCSKINLKSKNQTHCEQMYSIYPLFGFDEETNEIRRMPFKIPTACMCVKYDSTLSRKCDHKEEIKHWNCTAPGSSYCTNVTDYDQKVLPKIKKALENQQVQDALYSHPDVTLFNERFSLISDSSCASNQRVIYPQFGKSTDGDWYTIVNTNKLQQKVVIDECLPESLDKKNVDSTKTCTQREAVFNLYAYDNSQNDITEMEFLLPYGCVMVERNVENGIKLDDQNTETVMMPESDSTDLDAPKCIKKLDNNLCLEVENYPTEYITKLFEKGAFDEYKTIHQQVEIATRISAEETLCAYYEQREIPTAYDSRLDGDRFSRMYVVQAKHMNFTQEFVHRYCISNAKCANVETTHTSTCVNKKVEVPMVVLYINGSISLDYITLWPWCVCQVM